MDAAPPSITNVCLSLKTTKTLLYPRKYIEISGGGGEGSWGGRNGSERRSLPQGRLRCLKQKREKKGPQRHLLPRPSALGDTLMTHPLELSSGRLGEGVGARAFTKGLPTARRSCKAAPSFLRPLWRSGHGCHCVSGVGQELLTAGGDAAATPPPSPPVLRQRCQCSYRDLPYSWALTLATSTLWLLPKLCDRVAPEVRNGHCLLKQINLENTESLSPFSCSFEAVGPA